MNECKLVVSVSCVFGHNFIWETKKTVFAQLREDDLFLTSSSSIHYADLPIWYYILAVIKLTHMSSKKAQTPKVPKLSMSMWVLRQSYRY